MRQGNEGTPVGEPPIVLIVEDEQSIAESVAMIVEDAGFGAMLAANGRQALGMARAYPPALVITDLMMPVMGGEEFVHALRADYAARGVAAPPIVLMTAASIAYAEELRPDAVIPKPFDVALVESILRRFLG